MNKNNESNVYLNNDVPINVLMYADDLIILSDSPEGLQKQIDKLNNYCDKWKLNINMKKTKAMIFNRGNKLINAKFSINNVVLENVRSMKYLGFTITSKNCSFLPTLEDLRIKVKRLIYALNCKIKISRFPIKLALKLFDEVWGPYLDSDFNKWETSKIEMAHTQFLKRVLGCSFHTSNIMTRGEVGVRPLLIDVNIKVLTYIRNIIERQQATVYTVLEFERTNDTDPNFIRYLNKFDLRVDESMLTESKRRIKKICHDKYDGFWQSKIMEAQKLLHIVNLNVMYLWKIICINSKTLGIKLP